MIKNHIQTAPAFPKIRMRRNRADPWCRRLIAENNITIDDLIWPIFVQDSDVDREEIPSLTGVNRISINSLLNDVAEAVELGIPMVAIFPVIGKSLKTEEAEEALNPENIVCRSVRALKKEYPDLGIMCDVALDPFTSHGHDGLVKNGYVTNDETLEVLCKQALVQAKAGCDIIAPSDLMDGRVGIIRQSLEKENFQNVRILSYAVKYASALYGPFRDALGSNLNLAAGDKKTYQMDPANGDEALREAALDISEGADMLMVKPGVFYLDILRLIKDQFAMPTFAYQVSGEYAMIKFAERQDWAQKNQLMLESLKSYKRAGADGILTYAAIEIARIIKSHKAI